MSYSPLRSYFLYTLGFPNLEFLIEQYLEGKHYQIEAVIKDGKIAYDMVMHYPNPCQSSLFGLPLGSYMIAFEDEVYKKAHAALVRLIAVIPHIKNKTMFYEFVYMDDEIYIMEACTRKSGVPCQRFFYESTGMNFEEALVKLAMDRTDFYIAPAHTFKKNVGYVMYMENTGIISRKNPYPDITSKIEEVNMVALGDVLKLSDKQMRRDKSLLVFLENEDRCKLASDIELLLKWQPFEYSTVLDS